MLAFVGANFVATIFLTWTPTFLVEKFGFKLTSAGLSGTVFIHLASAVSVPLAGVLADRLTRRLAGGRMLVQALGLLAGAAFVVLVGRTAEHDHAHRGDDRLRLLQGLLRFGHLRLALRRDRTAGTRHGGRPDEHGRLGRRRARAAVRRLDVEVRRQTDARSRT